LQLAPPAERLVVCCRMLSYADYTLTYADVPALL
jgi:hypothetical protein